ncbi:MAG: hypothetical protein ACOCVR_02215 [Myxococcota bacterium]
MSTRRMVDVMVLGGRTGPLSAACLLARRGYKVLHVEHEGLSSYYMDDGLALPLEPDLVPGPKSSPVIARVLDALALATDAQRMIRRVVPDLQVISPGHRFDLSLDANRRDRELSRELGPEEAERAQRALYDLLAADEALDPLLEALPPLPPAGFRESRVLRKAAAEIPLDGPSPLPIETPPLEGALHGLARLSSYLWAEQPGHLHSVRSRARLLRGGVHRLDRTEEKRGGGYAPLLRRRLEELGGESLREGQAVCEEILIEKGQIAGLKVLGETTDYRCRYLVSGLDTGALRRLLPLEGRRRKYDTELERVRSREMLFTLNLVLNRRGLPQGLGEAAIHLTGKRGVEENMLLLEKFEAVGEDGPLPEMVVLQASCFLPVTRRELGDGYLEEMRERVLSVLEADLLPFLQRHLVLASSPLLTRKGPARGARLTPHPLLQSDIEPALGVGLLAPHTPYKNLVLAGREVAPGLGVEGEFLTGHRAAEIVAHAARKHDPLKRQ